MIQGEWMIKPRHWMNSNITWQLKIISLRIIGRKSLPIVFWGFVYQSMPDVRMLPNTFPKKVFTLNPSDLNGSVSMINEHLNSNHYEKVFSAIQESRNRVLSKYNLFAILSNHISNLYQMNSKEESPYRVLSRPRIWKEKPHCRLGCFLEKSKRIMVNSFKNAFSF